MTQTLQQLISENLNVSPVINPTEQYRLRVNALKGFLKESGRKGYVMNVTSEQGNVLSAHITQTAIKELRQETGDLRYLFLSLFLPDGQENVQEANEVTTIVRNYIKVDAVSGQDIKQSIAAAATEYPNLLNDKCQMATRVRTAITKGYAKERNYLTVGVGHSSQHILGEETLHGDTVADVQPLAGLSRHQVNQMLHHLNAPAFLLAKVPTVSSTGVDFNKVDKFLGGADMEIREAHAIQHRFLTTQHTRRVKAPFITEMDKHLLENNSRLLATM